MPPAAGTNKDAATYSYINPLVSESKSAAMFEQKSDRAAEIARHEALIRELGARGLPTHMATNILEKLIAEQGGIAARAGTQRAVAPAQRDDA